ncbi:hypothetical protein [Plantactinospora soyae]|uniref:Uncharacterized protein n=1 Tax=Plantactinospora soyae TaxID=1544732 RepID=A0A927MHT5_9ACTN|nr:hypothetical protein [Plantactinospora soyae]MBE1491933.1 hypothetical protein [Plantactinospora soyae]
MSTGAGAAPAGKSAARLHARLHTVLGQGGDPTQLAVLHRDAAQLLGESHETSLLVECALEHALSPDRPVSDSLAAWLDLRERAGSTLAEHHPTVLAVRDQYIRWLRRRGEPGDLDLVVQLRRDEVELRATQPVGPHQLGVAATGYAVALLDRARYGSFDPQLKKHEPGTDLAEAYRLVDGEISRRGAGYGSGHESTWQARLLLGDIRCAGLRLTPDDPDLSQAEPALREADTILRYDWQRHGRHGRSALRAQLVRAEVLTVLGRDRAAEREARLASVLARRYSDLDLGRPLLVLAQAQAHRDAVAALRTARAAVRERRLRYPPAGHRLVEAERLVQTLSASAHRTG